MSDILLGRGWIPDDGDAERQCDNDPSHLNVVRLPGVIVKIKPHISKAKYKGGTSGVDSDGFRRIATSLLDAPAEIIVILYEYRWTIEIFFRQFKHLLGYRHLLSHNQNGITIQAYGAIIACLLIAMWTGRKPTKRTHEMLYHLLTGWASAEEVAAHLAKLKDSDEKVAKQTDGQSGSTATRDPSPLTLREQ
ncbi:MAG: transposase [Planctomycetota bacterium]